MKLAYKKFGEGEKPLIIVHGLLGSGDNWHSLAKKFASEYAVYAVDQRNHGHSPQSPDMNYELLSEDIFELAAELGLREINLIGHSMGGKTILRFAQRYDFLISKMVVADMGIKKYPPHHEEIFKGLYAVDVENCLDRKQAEERLSQYVTDNANVQFLMKNLYWKQPGKLEWRFNLQALFESRFALMEPIVDDPIETPVLFLRSGRSNYVLMEDMPEIKELVHHASFETMENAGHWLHADAPQEFFDKVNLYLHA